MKKQISLLLAAILVLPLFAGCRKAEELMPDMETTRPLATITPTLPEPIQTTAPSSEASVHTIPPEQDETESATIEDGNGPIPGQTTSEK